MDAAVKCAVPSPRCYQRRRPARTLWYRTVQAHFETWLELSIGQGDASPPAHVEQAFRRYLECGILAHGFARTYCDTRLPDRIFLQRPWCVPILQHAAHGRDGSASGRPRLSPATRTAMGALRAQAATLFLVNRYCTARRHAVHLFARGGTLPARTQPRLLCISPH